MTDPFNQGETVLLSGYKCLDGLSNPAAVYKVTVLGI